MGKMRQAYQKQDKSPRKGVRADDADEYVNKAIPGWDKSVAKGGAYREQFKSPPGRGSRGPSQADGGPISGWNVPVKEYGAYGSQEKWGGSAESGSLGFKPSGPGYDYLGHFAEDKNLRQGHNDGPNMNMDGVSGGVSATDGQNSAVSAASQSASQFSNSMKTYEDEHGTGRMQQLKDYFSGGGKKK
jgi:hypothetical protein